jgi:peptidoglycan hydrolase CwlO-like protein
MKILKKYFIYIIVSVLVVFASNTAVYAEEVCFSEKDAVDLITLLDASERDIELLSSCHKLVNELHAEISIRDKKINTLTDDLIQANQKVIKYQKKYERAKRIAWYTTAAGVIVILVQILPAAL